MRKIGLCVGLLLAMMLSACGLTPVQREQVGTFGSATKAIGDLPGVQFAQLRDDVIVMNREAALLRKDVPTAETTFDQPLSVDSIAKRTAAVSALASYGDVLNKLVSDDESKAVQSAATDLVTNFNSVAALNLSSDRQGAAVTVIDALTGLYIEGKKKKAVIEIVNTYACPVDQLAQLLMIDFGADAATVKQTAPLAACPAPQLADVGVVFGYQAAAGRLSAAAISTLRQGASFEERRYAQDAFELASENYKKSVNLQQHGVAALQALRKANAKLEASLRDPSIPLDEIKDFAKTVKQLASAARVLANH